VPDPAVELQASETRFPHVFNLVTAVLNRFLVLAERLEITMGTRR
jgi:hypothetical protein